MEWVWELDGWPHFHYDANAIAAHESAQLHQAGILGGAFRHLLPADCDILVAGLATNEATMTSAIEGEALDRDSVRSSILRHLGLPGADRRAGKREEGIAAMTVSHLNTVLDPLSNSLLFEWHRLLFQEQSGFETIGAYRTHADPMQIVSGPVSKQTVHYVAPPSGRVPKEMERFIAWFNGKSHDLPAIARSGIAHLHFEVIHPFEDGNGRIGRAIADKALAQAAQYPQMTMLSTEIESRRDEYYDALRRASQSLDATEWLVWYAGVVHSAQARTERWIEFLIGKTHLLDRLRGQINERQEKAVLRLFRAGPEGLLGGLSSANYQKISGASPATAGRDLAELVQLGALLRTGSGKGTRYSLNT